MINKKISGFILPVLISAAVITACASAAARAEREDPSQAPRVPDTRTVKEAAKAGASAEKTPGKSETPASRDSLDWQGLYRGRTPSAGGSGIDVEISLYEDNFITIRYKYVGRNDSFTAMAPFVWDDSGNVIISDFRDLPRYYKVCEDYLLQLDIEGNVITGNLADMYILKKVK
ncbi:MAG: copper resistance protein NlpE [Treponema sp.]|jgi:uncharacterized lipoprotein NlpE involved in copper resistance|nr:copper resistance protein NlpE [Treponema sp.]